MLVKIGPPREPGDVVDLLLECHERIRLFATLAGRLANAQNATPDEIRDAARRVTRYFSESLPLHVADEEESIVPRLSGHEQDLDASLERMHEEHAEHQPLLDRLLQDCRTLEQSPDRLEQIRREGFPELALLLESEFAAHLQEEEEIVFPAIRRLLTNEEREAILRELRARRET